MTEQLKCHELALSITLPQPLEAKPKELPDVMLQARKLDVGSLARATQTKKAAKTAACAVDLRGIEPLTS